MRERGLSTLADRARRAFGMSGSVGGERAREVLWRTRFPGRDRSGHLAGLGMRSGPGRLAGKCSLERCL